jgi:heme/copper-type cytochrome/quinol oxidase subunit 2
MTPILATLLHGDDIDLIYFWSSLLIVALPLTVFGLLTYLVVKGYRKKEQRAGSREQQAP